MFVLLLTTVLATTPADEVRTAAADVEQLPREAQRGVRYLTFYNLKPEQREQALQVVNYTLNALSRSRTIGHVTQISPTLLRFSIAQYASQRDEFTAWSNAWEKLAECDPYFHIRTEVVANSRKLTVSGELRERLTSSHVLRSALHSGYFVVTTDGGWTDLAAAARLRHATHSIGALLRADYFVANSTIPPRYYEFAGIADNENDFVKLLGLDRTVVDRLRANAGANIIISGVTGKPRRVVWSQGPLGGVYATLDVQQVDAERDPLRRPVSVAGLNLRFDASEWFAVAPNGLWRTAIFDAAGKRQNAVSDRVAKDTSDPHGDGIVVPMLSCIRCHRESGLRPFSDDQTRLLAGRVDLFSDDPKIVQRAAEFYDEPRLQRQMKFDRETYAAAVARATQLEFAQKGVGNGLREIRSPTDITLPKTTPDPIVLQPDQLADALSAVVRNYAYLPVTLELAAREVGLSQETFRAAMHATQDPIILTLLEGRPVLRGQWDSSFSEAALRAAATASKP